MKKFNSERRVFRLKSSEENVSSSFGGLIKIVSVIVIILASLAVLSYQEKEKQLASLENQLEREENALNAIYSNIDNRFSEADISKNETQIMAKSAINAIVCSEANYYNNKAQKAYGNFLTYQEEVESKLPDYQKRYDSCKKLLEEINQMQRRLGYQKFSKLSVVSYKQVVKEKNCVFSNDAELKRCTNAAQQYADKLFNEYYPLMLPLTTGEAGDYYYPDEDQFYVMNVAENRVKSKYYPNTIYEVIFQPGQYQPTWDGSWSKQPDQRTKKNVEKYLRGKVDTGMPDNIVFQAMFKQGDYVWKHISNPVDTGHYYCAKV